MFADLIVVNPFGDRLQPGPGAAVVVLVAFLVSFLAIRTSARLTRSVSWWPGGIETEGGVHIHHLVFGICLMLFCGFLAFAAPLASPWWHLVAIGFGVGAGFTLDEFALWVRLEDVYWSHEGRSLVRRRRVQLRVRGARRDRHAAVRPRRADLDRRHGARRRASVLGLAGACFAKGRVLLGVVGLFIPIFALAGAVRLARPGSAWAKWRYDAATTARAEARFADTRPLARANRRLGDLVVGAPGKEGA